MCDGSGQRIWLLASEGDENVPSLGDEVPAGSHAAKIVRFHASSVYSCLALTSNAMLSMFLLTWDLISAAHSVNQQGQQNWRDLTHAPSSAQVGSVVFSDVKKYTSLESWAADAEKHRVPGHSPYAYQQAGGPTYGWCVGATERLPQPLPLPLMKRLLRSIYEIPQAQPMLEATQHRPM